MKSLFADAAQHAAGAHPAQSHRPAGRALELIAASPALRQTERTGAFAHLIKHTQGLFLSQPGLPQSNQVLRTLPMAMQKKCHNFHPRYLAQHLPNQLGSYQK